jgi:hypothetical protein
MLAPPKPPPDPEALIPEARERHRRRQLLTAASVAVAAALGLGIYAVTVGSDSSRSARSAPLGPGGVPLCRSSDISVSTQMLTGVISRGSNGLFVMTNTSSAACSLPLLPPSTSITRHGLRLPVQQMKGHGIFLASWAPLRATHLLKPGGEAAISSYWQNWCGAHSFRPMYTEHYRFDRQLSVSLPIGPHPFCSDRGGPSTVRVSRPLLVRG